MFKNNVLNAFATLSLIVFVGVIAILPGCDFASEGTLQDWLDSFNPQPDPVQVDTCGPGDWHQESQPKFITVWVPFDCIPDTVLWRVQNLSGTNEDLADMIMALNPALDTVEVYVSDSGDEVAAVIYGTDDKAWLQGRISARPSCYAVQHLPDIGRQMLNLGNALSFEDWVHVLDQLPSNSGLVLKAPSLSQDMKNLIWEDNLDYDSCKVAPTFAPFPSRADFRFDNAPQSIRDRYVERGWNIIE